MDRRIRDLEDAFEAHRADAYAHGAMIGRIMQENVSLRERFENRLAASEKRIGVLEGFQEQAQKTLKALEAFKDYAIEKLGTLENFKGQVTLLGGIGFLLLGVVVAGLIQRIFNISL